jgi:hypothetical protein
MLACGFIALRGRIARGAWRKLMNERNEVAPAGQLVLARLLVAGEKGATTGELKKALEPLLGHRWSGPALDEQLARTLADLHAAGLVERSRRGKTERALLLPEGHRHALAFLGLEQLPPKTTWDQLKKTFLAARALGLPTPTDGAARSFKGDPGFKAALLKTEFGLPLDDYPSFDQAIDALAWRLMGFAFETGTGPKFSVKAVKAALLQRALDNGRPVDPRADPKKEATRLLARKVGARQSGKDELRLAAIRRWTDQAQASGAEEPSRPTPISAPAPIDLDTFARRVLEAARSSRSGRFGGHRVFVVHVWRALRDEPGFAELDLDGFKQRLAEANNSRRLDLSRADMVEAMDEEDVRLSEISYLGSSFHFIRI